MLARAGRRDAADELGAVAGGIVEVGQVVAGVGDEDRGEGAALLAEQQHLVLARAHGEHAALVTADLGALSRAGAELQHGTRG